MTAFKPGQSPPPVSIPIRIANVPPSTTELRCAAWRRDSPILRREPAEWSDAES
jgi:hypothetical protein